MNPQRTFPRFILGISAILFASCSFLSTEHQQEDFIRIRGTTFIHRDAPYHIVGTNMWYGAYLGSPGSTGNTPRLLRELDSLNLFGITNIRVLAASEESAIRRSVLTDPF